MSRNYEPTNPNFFRSTTWKKLRAAVLKRDKETCVSCGSKRTPTVRHKKPRETGGEDSLLNLETLCPNCLRKTQEVAEVRKLEVETHISSYVDTMSRPKWHEYVYGGRRGAPEWRVK